MKTFDIQIQTPIWTGGINKQCDKLHETGFIGSLRWWYEVILRGSGHRACDPSMHSCSEESGFCKACEIFGATGLRRKFQLKMNGGETVFSESQNISIKPVGRNRGWYYGSGVVGRITLQLIPLNNNPTYLTQVEASLLFASKRAGLGAKTQHGYGVVTLVNQPQLDLSHLPSAPSPATSSMPDLRHFFFAKVQFSVFNKDWWKKVDGLQRLASDSYLLSWIESGSAPIAPAVKNWLRFRSGMITDSGVENFIFGTVDPTCPHCFLLFTI